LLGINFVSADFSNENSKKEEMEDAFSGKGAAATSKVIVEITFARKNTMGCVSYAY
jgi:hypothetical protein